MYWQASPFEIQLAFKAQATRLRREHNQLAWHAWTAENLRRSKKLPDIRRLYAREPRAARRRQTWQEMLAVARQWVAASGGTIRPPSNQGK